MRLLGSLPSGSPARRRFRFTAEGVIYLAVMTALFSSAILSQINLLMLVFGIMAGPFILSGSIVLSMLRSARVRRRLPPYAIAAQPFAVEIDLAATKPWLSIRTLVVRDYLSRSRSDPVGLTFFDRVVPGHPRAAHYQATLRDRGRYRFGHLRLSTRFPLGLLERAKLVEAPDDLVVYPRLGRLTRRWRQLKREMLESERPHRPRKGLMQDDYHGLRDFRPGDSARWIHWRTTARKGQLMVKEFEHPLRQDMAILLDPWLPLYSQPADHDRLEQAVSLVATLCVDLLRTGSARLLLGIGAPEPCVYQATASQRLMHELLKELAVVRGSHRAGLGPLLERLVAVKLAGLAFVIVTPRALDLYAEFRGPDVSPPAQAVWRAVRRRAHVLSVVRGDVAAHMQLE